MILYQLLKKLFQNTTEGSAYFKYSVKFITCLLDTWRENHYLFKEANLRSLYSLEYCLGQAVLSAFQMALIVKWDCVKPQLDQLESLLLLYSELIKLSLFGLFGLFGWIVNEKL